MTPILFGQSYFLRFDPKLFAAMQPYPPLGTMYAASYLRARGYNVALFDAMLAESENGWAAALDRERPQFAVLFEDSFNYLSKMCLLRMRAAAINMIELAKARGCTVILCGADATDHATLYFERGADFVLLGEGEETLGELMDVLTGKSSQPLDGILGLAYQNAAPGGPDAESAISNQQSAIRLNARRSDISRLDDLPFPAWDLIDVEKYRSIWRERHGYFSMNMVTTRGGPYHCNWCAKPIWGQRYNSRSPENVAAELKWLKDTYHPDHIWFADDIFGLKPGWIEKFGQRVKDQNAGLPFKCLSRADLIKPSVVDGLKQAGCQIVWLGAESGAQKILDAMDKGTTVPQIYEARRLLGEAGIKVAFFLQFGYPGETRVEVEATLKLVRETLPDDIGISVSYPLPGTKFYERVKAQLGEKQNWTDSDDLAMLYHGPFPQEFYRVLHRVVHGEFRLRKAWQALKRGSISPRRLASIPRHWLSWQINRRRLDRWPLSARDQP